VLAARAVLAAGGEAKAYEMKSFQALPGTWQVAGGSWTFEGGCLKGSPGEAAEATLLLEAAPRDLVVEMDCALVSAVDPARWFAVLVRDRAGGPGVQFTIRQDTAKGNGLEFASRRTAPVPGKNAWRVIQTAAAEAVFADGKLHRVRLEAAGDWIRGFIDGKMVIRSYRGYEFPSPGRVGIRLSGATVSIERVTVKPIEAASMSDMRVRTRPLVVAHRGFSWIAPENTLASYRKAIEVGADMAECDVYLTTDKVPVLMHDGTLTRTTGARGRLRDLTLEQARKLDAGKWKGPQYAGERIPTLAEALQLVKGKLRFVIEIKEEGIAAEVLKTIRASEIAPQDLMIFSFYSKAVEDMARLEPLLPTTWLVDNPGTDAAAWRKTLAEALRIRASAIGTSVPHVDPGFVRLAHECGLNVFVWTADEPEEMAFLRRIGVDAIITDRPDVLLEMLKSE
jgi:glycerophosphoryl diester phosphodiesterase